VALLLVMLMMVAAVVVCRWVVVALVFGDFQALRLTQTTLQVMVRGSDSLDKSVLLLTS
jgi:hypothetical protein